MAGALRELLLRYDGAADAPLIAGVPVSYGNPDRLVGNEFTYMTPSLAVHVDDPLERVRLTATSTEIAKENHHLLGPKLVADWLNYLPPSMAPSAFRWQSKRVESSMIMNLTVSNVPGPRERGSFGGASDQRDLLRRPARRGQRHERHGVELRRPAQRLGAHRRSDDRRPARGDRRDDPIVRRTAQGRRAVGGTHGDRRGMPLARGLRAGDEVLEPSDPAEAPAAMALAADDLARDAQLLKDVLKTLDRGTVEVTIWGERLPSALTERVQSVRYQLSAAARAFKAQALVAAGEPAQTVDAEEEFHSSALWYPPDGSDLSPVS